MLCISIRERTKRKQNPKKEERIKEDKAHFIAKWPLAQEEKKKKKTDGLVDSWYLLPTQL